MLIDGFTVFAQMVNFLILMGLMRRYLYKPILGAIEEREKAIAATLQDARAKQDEAEQQRKTLASRNVEFEKQREGLLIIAREVADKEGRGVLEQARTAADKIMANSSKALAEQEKDLCQALYSRAQKEAFNLAGHVLKELADVEIQDRMLEVFLQRLDRLEANERKILSKAKTLSPVLRSAFELKSAQRGSLKQALALLLGAECRPRFEVSSDLVAGFELVTEGYKMSWSLSGGLSDLKMVAVDGPEPASGSAS